MSSAGKLRLSVTAATLFLGVAALVTGATGCLSVRHELTLENQRRQADWQQRHAAALAPSAAAIPLTWNDALARLRAGNEKIRAADLDCLRADENLQQVRRSLIPLLSLQGGYNQALTNGTHIDPFTFAANVFFDVPGMIGYRLRQEAAQLVVIRARLGLEAVWREQVIELYRAFSSSAQLGGEQREIARAQALAATPDAAAFRASLDRRQTSALAAQTAARTQLSQLLGAPELTFACRDADLPPLVYDTPAGRPSATELARLPLRLAAVELVALRARELGVNLQYWPEFSVYVTSPAVYSRNGGQDSFWSSHDIFVGANVYWTLDTRGRNASQKRVLAAEAQLRREVLEHEAAKLSLKIEGALASLAATDAQLAALPAPASQSTAIDTALAGRRAALAAERREWQLVLWFFDDSRWPGVPALPAPVPPASPATTVAAL